MPRLFHFCTGTTPLTKTPTLHKQAFIQLMKHLHVKAGKRLQQVVIKALPLGGPYIPWEECGVYRLVHDESGKLITGLKHIGGAEAGLGGAALQGLRGKALRSTSSLARMTPLPSPSGPGRPPLPSPLAPPPLPGCVASSRALLFRLPPRPAPLGPFHPGGAPAGGTPVPALHCLCSAARCDPSSPPLPSSSASCMPPPASSGLSLRLLLGGLVAWALGASPPWPSPLAPLP